MGGYPSYPNLDTARVALSDAKKQKNGSLVVGDQYGGWLLTPAGIQWSDRHGDETGLLASTGRTALRVQDSNALESLHAHRVYTGWLSGDLDLDLYELAEAIQLPADAPRRIVLDRAQELASAAAAASDEKMGEFLKWLKGVIEKAR